MAKKFIMKKWMPICCLTVFILLIIGLGMISGTGYLEKFTLPDEVQAKLRMMNPFYGSKPSDAKQEVVNNSSANVVSKNVSTDPVHPTDPPHRSTSANTVQKNASMHSTGHTTTQH
jgi:hypothetical protein